MDTPRWPQSATIVDGPPSRMFDSPAADEANEVWEETIEQLESAERNTTVLDAAIRIR